MASLSALALLGIAVPAGSAPVTAGDESPSEPQRAPCSTNFTFVGHSPLDGFNDYGDLYAHGDFAYVGSRCSATRQGGAGVQVVDISHPTRPRLVGTLPQPGLHPG